jgi:hypothetical protein
MVNWKTSIAGIATILSALGLIGHMLQTGGFDVNTITLAITQIMAGVGLLGAKDGNVTGIGDKATTDVSKDATAPKVNPQ